MSDVKTEMGIQEVSGRRVKVRDQNGAAVGIPIEICEAFGFETGADAQWFTVTTPWGKILELRPATTPEPSA